MSDTHVTISNKTPVVLLVDSIIGWKASCGIAYKKAEQFLTPIQFSTGVGLDQLTQQLFTTTGILMAVLTFYFQLSSHKNSNTGLLWRECVSRLTTWRIYHDDS